MPKLLPSWLLDLSCRCERMQALLLECEPAPPADAHALRLYRRVLELKDRIQKLRDDPALDEPILLRQNQEKFTRLAEEVVAFESYPLPAVLRFSEHDALGCALCARLMAECGITVDPPLLACFSTDYYSAVPPYGLIFVPALESSSLLGLPDLLHEVAHLVLAAHYGLLLHEFLDFLSGDVKKLKRRLRLEQHPLEPQELDWIGDQWRHRWVLEFVADMIAVYACGECYAWQHLRLCSQRNEELHAPALREDSEHPAPEARFRGIVAMLKAMGASSQVESLRHAWREHETATGQKGQLPPNYERCYPEAWLERLAKEVARACGELGMRRFDDATHEGHEGEATTLVAESRVAWKRLMAATPDFAAWEKEQMTRLHGALAPTANLQT